MSISHGATTRTAICDVVVDRLDLGAGAAKLKFLTAADALLCTVTLSDPAFSAASGPTATLLGVPLSGTVIAGGSITKFYATDSVDVVVVQGTVATSGADINLSSVAVNINDVIQIDSISYTASV